MAQFKKGQSGNPNGRPKTKPEDKTPTHDELVKEFSVGNMKAFKKAMSIMSKGSEANQLKAAFKIMDTYITLQKMKGEDGEYLVATKTNKQSNEVDSNVVPLITSEYRG